MTKTPKRPRDVSQLAKMIVDIASGDGATEEKKKPREKSAGLKAKEAKDKS